MKQIYKEEDSSKEMIMITKEEYEYLLESSKVLNALDRGGVENWDFYYDSINDNYPEYFKDE